MRIKKFFAWVLCIVALIMTVFLPYANVFAATSLDEAKKSGNYDDLVQIRYLTQAADACILPAIASNGHNVVMSLVQGTPERRKDVRAIYELRISENSTDFDSALAKYDSTELYNASLEVQGQGEYKNGSVYCKQLGIDPGAILMEKYGLNNEQGYTDLICGKNGKPGLFTVKMGYDALEDDPDNYIYHEDVWPSGWTKTDTSNGGVVNDCRDAVKHLIYYAEHPDKGADFAIKTIEGYGYFKIGLIKNKNFSFSDFFSSYTGFLDEPNEELLDAEQYEVFENACVFRDIDEVTYKNDIKESVGGDYKIYHNGTIRYINMSAASGSRETYANGKLTKAAGGKESVTCQNIVDSLASKADTQYAKDEANRKSQQIVECYETAVANKERLQQINVYLSSIYRVATMLADNAEAFKNNGYKPIYVTDYGSDVPVEVVDTFRADYESLALGYINGNDADVKVGMKELMGNKGNAVPGLDSFAELIKDFETVGRGYRDKVIDGTSLTDEDKKAFDDALDSYKEAVSKFNSDILKPALKLPITHTFPNFDDFSGTVSTLNSCLSNNSCQTPANTVASFYAFGGGEQESDKLSCTLNSYVTDALDDLGELLGATINYDEFTASDPTSYDTYEPSQDGNTDPCYNAGVEGMSWIVCPTLNNGVKVSDGISNIIDGMLAIDSDTYNDASNAKEAWNYFRDMANVIAIIILLVIIVSQVTGYGIDNYGIKKLLPRLLVTMVLINISFLICQLVIDLSNILGGGLSDMFKAIGKSLYKDGAGFDNFASRAILIIFGILGLAGSAAGAAVTVGSVVGGGATMVIIVVAMLLIVAVVAIVMFFLILGARGIIVILFTAISPLALACNILPNTQNLFKKWWSIFKTALIVYPICGALYGISFIIRAIVLKNGENGHLAMAMAAVIAPYLPFLVLPTLTKGALAGLGAISGALTGLGNGIKSGIGKGQNALQHTEAYKNAQELASRNRTMRLGGLQRNKQTGKLEEKEKYKGKPLSSRMGKFRRQAISNELARMEEEGMYGMSLEAGVAGVDETFSRNLEKNAASLISFGSAKLNNGRAVQPGNLDDLKQYHGEALGRYRLAEKNKDEKGKAEALAQIRATQSTLSKTDKGRGYVIESLESAIRAGEGHGGEGVKQAAMHLQSEFGDLYKIKNRGANALIGALAGGDGSAANLAKFAMEGANKYDQSTLVGADDLALERMAEAFQNFDKDGTVIPGADAENYEAVRDTAKRAIEMYNAGRLSIKKEVLGNIETIAGVSATGGTSSGGESQTFTETFSAKGADGAEVTFKRGENGQWYDNQNRPMEGDFEHVKQQINESRQRQEQQRAREEQQKAYEELFKDK